MADRYPLVVDTTDSNKIKELPNGDSLNLTGNNITGAINITATGTITATDLNITNGVTINSLNLATVATTGDYSDLIGFPTQVSTFANDSQYVSQGQNVSVLTNDAGYLTTVTFSSIIGTPSTLGGYGITDAATQAQGALAQSALQPADNISTLTNDAGFVTLTQLTDGSITVDVNNSGDLVGSVFADDSTVMIDSILAAVNLDGTIRSNVKPHADTLYDLGSSSNQFKDLYINGEIKFGSNAVPIDLPANSTVNGIVIGSGSGGSGGGFITIAADDSTQRIINRGETFKISGGAGISTSSDAEGEITITGAGTLNTAGNTGTGSVSLGSETLQVLGTTNEINVDAAAFALSFSLADNISGIQSLNATTSLTGGAVVLSGSNIDTSDSSAMTITPAVTFESDLIVQNNLTVDNDLNVTGSFNTVGSGTPEIFSDNEIELNAGTRIQATSGPFQMLAVTTAQRDTLTPADADILYNTSLNVFQGRANGSWVSLSGSGGLANVVDDTTPQLGGNLDAQAFDITTTGKILFANVYNNLVDLPSASTYHGMFAHVHATGKAYFAHGGAWIELANSATTLAGYGITDGYANSDVDTHLNTSGASNNEVLSWTGSDYAWVANAGGGGSTAADDITVGDAAVNIATTTGNITIDAQGSDTDIIFKGTDDAADITALTLDMSAGGRAIFNASMELNNQAYIWFKGNSESDKIYWGGGFGDTHLGYVSSAGLRLLIGGSSNNPGTLSFDSDDHESIGSDGTNLLLKSGNTTFKIPTSDGSAGEVLQTDGNGVLSFVAAGGGDVVDDTSPQLGGDLDVNGKTIAHTFVLGANGISDYTFSDAGNIWFPTTENDPVLYLRRGEQYIFTNNSGGSHPFEIRTGSGGSAYNTGVTNNGASSGNIIFKVPMSAPSTLYYQCTSHGGMGNTINIV